MSEHAAALRAPLGRRAITAWCVFAGLGVVVPSLVDVYAVSWHGGGRVFLSSLFAFHLIYVPAIARAAAPAVLLEAAALAALAMPAAEVLRQMGGADSAALGGVAASVFFAHAIGGAAGRLSRDALRRAYYPLAVVVALAWPLTGYAMAEFFGVESGGGWRYGPMPWLVAWLDAPA